MSFFGSKLFGLSSNGAASSQSTSSSSISGAETIERLCERVQQSLLVDDRKDSLNAIKSLSKKYKLEVGTQAMPILIDILKQNRMDPELCCLSLDILLNVMKTSSSETEHEHPSQNLPVDISIQFSEMFIKDLDNLTLLFELIDEFEFQIRWSTLKLLNQLIVNLESLSQEKILQVPRGVSRLIDLLNDSREVIRNDAIILLINLTKTNGNIQKIVAFESGFDRIMEIIDSEGNVLRGGIIVEDCLNLLINLLQGNSSNQSFFKEANFIKVICKYLDLSDGGGEIEATNGEATNAWSAQKCTNLSLLLKLIRCLVSPSNQQHVVTDSQKAFSHFGLLHRLCALLTMPGVPADTLGEAIKTVGEVIRGDASNQQLFSNVIMQANPPRSLVTILLFSMINDKQPFQLRNSILYCFECYLHKNEEKKREIIETLLPKDASDTSGANVIKSGQILCNGLFNPTDSTSNWLCAVALAHTINESVQLKEQLLRVQLAVNSNPDGSGEIRAVSLMEQCMMILIEQRQASVAKASVGAELSRFQTTIAILMLMATWLVDSPPAVNMFLAQQQNIPYLISQASSAETDERSQIIQGICSFLLGLSLLFNSDQVPMYTIEKLKDTIKKRIGLEQFEHKLEYISQHEAYTKTLKLTAVTFKSVKPADLLFDYEFARLFKSNETIILNALRKNTINPVNNQQLQHQASTNSSHRNYDTSEWEQQIAEYRKIIRELDAKLGEERQLNQSMAQTCAQLQQSIYQLQMQQQHASALAATAYEQQEWLTERLRLQAKIGELEVKVNLLEEKCSEQEDELCKLQREKGNLQETLVNIQTTTAASTTSHKNDQQLEAQNKSLKAANAQLTQEQESLLTLLSEMEAKIKRYRRMLKDRGETNLTDNEDDDEVEEEGEENNDNSPLEQARSASASNDLEPPSSPLLANLNDTNNVYPTIIPAATITPNGLNLNQTDQAASNPIDFINSFSNSFAQHLNFEQQQQQQQQPGELQNYFK